MAGQIDDPDIVGPGKTIGLSQSSMRWGAVCHLSVRSSLGERGQSQGKEISLRTMGLTWRPQSGVMLARQTRGKAMRFKTVSRDRGQVLCPGRLRAQPAPTRPSREAL